jgi:hypothetical protein
MSDINEVVLFKDIFDLKYPLDSLGSIVSKEPCYVKLFYGKSPLDDSKILYLFVGEKQIASYRAVEIALGLDKFREECAQLISVRDKNLQVTAIGAMNLYNEVKKTADKCFKLETCQIQ